jgi:hypothetical protein
MASPARSRTTDSLGGDLGPAAVKGGILVFVALVLGVALLLQGTDSDVEASSPSGDESTGDGNGTPSTTDEATGPDNTSDTTESPSTTAGAEPRPPDEVTVLVANGSGIAGAAGALSTQLQGLGYHTAEPDNTPAPVSSSNVFYIPGFEAEARAVAQSLGLDPDAEGVVAEVPSPVPTLDASMGAANLLVVMGPDLAPTTGGAGAGTTDTTAPTSSE